MNANVDSIKQHLKKIQTSIIAMMHQVEIDSQELVKIYPPVWIRRKIIIRYQHQKGEIELC